MQRRPPAGTTRRVRSAMRCDKRPRSLTAKTSADFLRKRSGHAAQAPGGYNPPGTERNVPQQAPPFPNRKNVRRLFAEEERPCSAGPRRVIPAGDGAQCAATF